MNKKLDSKFLDLSIRTSPHVARPVSVKDIMRNVVFALFPISAYAVYAFGLSALLLLSVTTVSAVLTEYLLNKIKNEEGTLGDFSAVITGLLLGLTLPPGFPLWMAVIGGIISIALGKVLFGGLGCNVFNPALVGRAFLQAAFPVAITTWNEPFKIERFREPISTALTFPFMKPFPQGVTGATPLSAMKFDHQAADSYDLLMGAVSGSTGELSAVIILVCGLYLAFRKMLDWRIPVGMMVSVSVTAGIFHYFNSSYPTPQFMLLAGGFMLGAWFMATDMVTSPVTPLGVWLFAFIIGFLIVIIRIFGGLPEGVMYAILLGNAVTPLLHTWSQPRVYGTKKRV